MRTVNPAPTAPKGLRPEGGAEVDAEIEVRELRPPRPPWLLLEDDEHPGAFYYFKRLRREYPSPRDDALIIADVNYSLRYGDTALGINVAPCIAARFERLAPPT